MSKDLLRATSLGIEIAASVFIGAGIGRFLVKELAENLGYRYLDFADLFERESNLLQQELETTGYSVADCAPAVAVAYLSGALFPNDVKILK